MQVVTVVAQRSDAVRRYIEESGLPFNILVDESRDVLKAYGVWHRLGLDAWNIARPALFLIDRDGIDPLFVRRRLAGGVPVARGDPAGARRYLKRFATSSQLTTFHQAPM